MKRKEENHEHNKAQKKRGTVGNGLVRSVDCDNERLQRTKRNTINSPLLRLPAELKIEIFTYALGGDVLQIDEGGTLYTSNKNTLALLASCKQVLSETCMLPYATNVFSFDGPLHMRSFLKLTTEKQRHAIESIEIVCMTAFKDVDSAKLSRDDHWGEEHLSFRRLPGLKRIHVDFTVNIRIPLDYESGDENDDEEETSWTNEQLAKDLVKLVVEKNSDVTVILSQNEVEDEYDYEHRLEIRDIKRQEIEADKWELAVMCGRLRAPDST